MHSPRLSSLPSPRTGIAPQPFLSYNILFFTFLISLLHSPAQASYLFDIKRRQVGPHLARGQAWSYQGPDLVVDASQLR